MPAVSRKIGLVLGALLFLAAAAVAAYCLLPDRQLAKVHQLMSPEIRDLPREKQRELLLLGPGLALTAFGVVGAAPLPTAGDQPQARPADPPANVTEQFIGAADQWPQCIVTADSFYSGLPVGSRTVYIQGSGACVIRTMKQLDAFGKREEKRYSLKLTAEEASVLRKLCIEANPVAVQLAARPGVPGSTFLSLNLRNAGGKEHPLRCLAIDKDKVAEFRKLFDAVDELSKKIPANARPDYEGAWQPQWQPFAKQPEK